METLEAWYTMFQDYCADDRLTRNALNPCSLEYDAWNNLGCGKTRPPGVYSDAIGPMLDSTQRTSAYDLR